MCKSCRLLVRQEKTEERESLGSDRKHHRVHILLRMDLILVLVQDKKKLGKGNFV